MRNTTAFVAVLIGVFVGCAGAQTPPSTAPLAAGAPSLSADSSVDEILDVLDARGTNLRNFVADVTLAHVDQVSGDESSDTGQAYFEQKADGDARVLVRFTKQMIGRRQRDRRSEYLLDEGWLWERDYLNKTEVKRQVLRPGQRINLLKLGEGPFPLPIGQSKESVHAMFEVEKVGPKSDDPPKTVHIRLVPRPETQFSRKFAAIDVWVDTESGMPRRIRTIDAGQTTERQTDLENLRVNEHVPAGAFALPEIDRTWDRHEEEFRE